MARASTIGPRRPMHGQGGTTMTPGRTPEHLSAADDSGMSTATAPASVRPRPRGDAPYAVVGRPRNEGHGTRLPAAFEALEVFPALAESRNRLLALIAEDRPSTGDVVRAIESDVALVISVLRLANGLESPRRGQGESIVGSVEVLSPEAVQRLATNAETFEFFERGKTWDAAPERFRLHAVAVQRAADRLAAAAGYAHRDRLLVTALLHDIGKLVLMHAYPGYPKQVHGPARTPEERLHYERRELGVDHALVGGVLARRWASARRGAGPPPPAAGTCPRPSHPRSSAITPTTRRATPRSSASRTCSRTTRRARRSPRPSCCGPPATSASDRASFAPSSTTFRIPAMTARAPSSRARSPRVRWTCSSGSPRAWSTSRSRSSSRSPPARCAHTSTTSTASLAPWTARRLSRTRQSAAGSKPERVVPSRPLREGTTCLALGCSPVASPRCGRAPSRSVPREPSHITRRRPAPTTTTSRACCARSIRGGCGPTT